ncbi:MAG: hypothetical protein ABI185_00360 [Ginsengibacter sp.]
MNDPIKVLDDTLNRLLLLKNDTPLTLKELHKLFSDENLNVEDFKAIINKLERDHYLDSSFYQNNPINLKLYRISFEGILLVKNNGYQSIFNIQANQKKTQNRKDWLMIAGTWIAGIGALVLTAWEIYKHYCLHID